VAIFKKISSVFIESENTKADVKVAGLQAQINNVAKNGILQLATDEYEGPIVISSPITLEGKGCTLWSRKGPVLSIQSDDVILRGIRVEVTEQLLFSKIPDNLAIQVKPGSKVEFYNVIIKGAVDGVQGEEGVWAYPKSLNLGSIIPKRENNYSIHIYVPVPCELQTQIYGMTCEPSNLNVGLNDVKITLTKIQPGAIIIGDLDIITTCLTRKINITGQVLEKSPKSTSQPDIKELLLWQPPKEFLKIHVQKKLPDDKKLELSPNEISKSVLISKTVAEKPLLSSIDTEGEIEMQAKIVEKMVQDQLKAAKFISEPNEQKMIDDLIDKGLPAHLAFALVRGEIDRNGVTSEKALREEVTPLVRVLVAMDKENIFRIGHRELAKKYLMEPRFRNVCYSIEKADALLTDILELQGVSYEERVIVEKTFWIDEKTVIKKPGSKRKR